MKGMRFGKQKDPRRDGMGNDFVITQSSLIRTLTVGTGISPVQKNHVPSSLHCAVSGTMGNSLREFSRGLYHRYGISPIPKDYDFFKNATSG
jgi:hypothetical protein